jgi:hypothetical protein
VHHKVFRHPKTAAISIDEVFVTIVRTGFLCLYLLFSFGAASASPQQQTPQVLSATQLTTPADSDAPSQNPTTQNPTTQTPPVQTPPAQTPPAQNPTTQTPPVQTPPAQNPTTQNPTTQTPPAQTPPAQTPPDQPTSTAPIVVAPPELPKYPDVRLPGEYGFYFGIDSWSPQNMPIFNKGRNSGITNNSYVTMQGKAKLGKGAEFGLALGLHNMLRFSYLETRAAGDFTTPVALSVVGGQTYAAGTFVSTDYNIQALKLSFDYLTLPYPVESRKFRLKTLYQVQYVSARVGFDAPLLPLVDANGNILIDANGNPLSYAASESKWFILPTFGLSATEYITRNLRFEASADGFAIPHHSTLYEGESTLNFRFSHFELRGGAKLFHFKTSTNQDFYVKGTLESVFFGIRWYSR